MIEFSELEEFVDLKLKNYSSGMRVRLGFAVLVEADADILLIDEVLAVGDAAFQQKCTDTFYDLKRKGRTIVLPYWRVPERLFDEPEEMLVWARAALAAARRVAEKKRPKKAR